MKSFKLLPISLFFLVFASSYIYLNQNFLTKKTYEILVKELEDKQYPNNPDIENRSSDWKNYKHQKAIIERHGKDDFSIIFLASNSSSDTIKLSHINLLEMIPTLPNYINNTYLKTIGIINAEWNRQEVLFRKGKFLISNEHEEGSKTTRVDLARNCLNSFLWELITFTEENGIEKPNYHGWFNFPKKLYIELFNEVNKGKLTFKEYENFLLDYKDPPKQKIDLNLLRSIKSEKILKFKNLNNQFYPLTGARKSKFKNIIYPKNPKNINDFLTDKTSFATFLYPGIYSKSDPRPTTLSMLAKPKKVIFRETISKNFYKDKTFELDVVFERKNNPQYITRVVIGGLKKDSIKQLKIEDYNKGLKMPMGIGNHSFYENIDYSEKHSSKDSPYYAFIIDGKGNWIDSHFFGIDGPLLHFDDKKESLLHYWLLSFERHAMVSHLTFTLY